VSTAAEFVTGTLALDGAQLTDAADSDAGAYIDSARMIRFDLGTLAGGQTGLATFAVRVAPVEQSFAGVINAATISVPDGPAEQSNQTIHPVDPLRIFKSATDLNGGDLRTGDVIEWKITVYNVGLTETTSVRVTDTVPSRTTYVDGSIAGRGADDSDAPALVWDVGTMAVGENVELTFRSKVNAGLAGGTVIKNQATVDSDQSNPKRSDDPKTSLTGDPTQVSVVASPASVLAKTGVDDRWILMLAVLALLGGGGLLLGKERSRVKDRKRKEAARRAARQARQAQAAAGM